MSFGVLRSGTTKYPVPLYLLSYEDGRITLPLLKQVPLVLLADRLR